MEPGDPPVTEEDIKKLEEQERTEKEEGKTPHLLVVQ